MTAKAKTIAAAATLVVAAVAWLAWPGGAGLPAAPPAGSGERALTAATGDVPRTGGAASSRESAPRSAVAAATAAAPTTGTLVVHVRYPDVPHEAEGLDVSLGMSGGDFRVGLRHATTDAAGTARFEAVPAGERFVRVMREGGLRRVDVRAGECTETSVDLRQGVTISGIVTDEAGIGIGGAIVEITLPSADFDVAPAARTSSDGAFVVRSSYRHCLVGARAAGYAASILHYVDPDDGKPLRIVLPSGGGCVTGIVLGPDGAPVAGAIVRVGTGRTDDVKVSIQGGDALPAQVRTDGEGRFLAVGVPVGEQPVLVHARDLAPWSGTTSVAAGATASVRVALTAGVTCVGTVRGEDGAAIAGAAVASGAPGEFPQYRTTSAGDGSFRLTGLPAAGFGLTASKRGLGDGTTRLRGDAGATVACELRLSNGVVLRGRVLDGSGNAVAHAEVMATATGKPRWISFTATDEEGRFLVAHCPSGRTFDLRLTKTGHVTTQHRDVDPRAGELGIRMPRDLAPARITGTVLGPAGAVGEPVQIDVFERPPLRGRVFADARIGEPFVAEVAAGRWELRIRSPQHPAESAGPRDLVAGETWDLGTVQLARGGRLVVRAPELAKATNLIVSEAGEVRSALYGPASPLQSELLHPGTYLLLVRTEGFAAIAARFTIRPGEDCELEVRLAPGVRQRFEFAAAAGGAGLPEFVGFELRRDGSLVTLSHVRVAGSDVAAFEVRLAPGDYVLRTRELEPATEVAFRVEANEGPPLRVTLR